MHGTDRNKRGKAKASFVVPRLYRLAGLAARCDIIEQKK